mmetsp:Transcript_15257/g.27163  ORF Transcript_15257/g.27163 Transcript_15257/m.27163 type:complete len:424 (-) Transcript_15257:165-1436(-)
MSCCSCFDFLLRRRGGSRSGEQLESSDRKPNVFCNVYDLTPCLNGIVRCVFCTNWGVYHTGVEVHGFEFAFGGHHEEGTGVFCHVPRATPARLWRTVPVGHTTHDPRQLMLCVSQFSTQWPGKSYSPLGRNCNVFSSSLCKELTGSDAPEYINRFASSCVVRRVAQMLARLAQDAAKRAEMKSAAGGGTGQEESELCIQGTSGMNRVLVEAATTLKQEANALFEKGKFQEAAAGYIRALASMRTLRPEEASAAEAKRVCVALLLNVAACSLKLQDYQRVVLYSGEALTLDPQNEKALFRRGVALACLGRPELAMNDLTQAGKKPEELGADNIIKQIEEEMDPGSQEEDAKGMASDTNERGENSEVEPGMDAEAEAKCPEAADLDEDMEPENVEDLEMVPDMALYTWSEWFDCWGGQQLQMLPD